MAKFCKICGTQLEDDAKFCTGCGAKIEEEAAAPAQEAKAVSGESVTENYENRAEAGREAGAYAAPAAEPAPGPSAAPGTAADITNRNIALCIILSIVTCGIYGIYWLYKLNDEMNALAGDTNGTSGGMVILLTLITCGIYGWYWTYKMGEKADQIKKEDSNKIIYLLLAIFGLSIIDYALMQDIINKAAA